MKKLQIDKNKTFQVRIDSGWWIILQKLKTDHRTLIRSLVEDALTNTYAIGNDGKPYLIKPLTEKANSRDKNE